MNTQSPELMGIFRGALIIAHYQSPIAHYPLPNSMSNAAPPSGKTGIAILGCGRWGLHLVRNFLSHPRAKVVAIADAHSDSLASLEQRLGATVQQCGYWSEVSLTTDWREAISTPGVEAVAIATPAATHDELITTTLNQGLHVLAEKPLTLDPQTCLALCDLADRQHCHLVIDHTYLFNPTVQQGKTVVQSGQLGQLRYGYASRTNLGPVRRDVDALWDLAIHDIAIFNHWLGQIPVEVSARGQRWLQSHASALDTPLYDLVWATLTYANGVQVTIHLCWLNPDKQRRLTLVGSQGSLVFDELLSPSPLTLYQGEFADDGLFTPINLAQSTVPVAAVEPLNQVCTHFLDCVQTNQASSISDGRVGTELVRILAALSRSLAAGGEAIALSTDEPIHGSSAN